MTIPLHEELARQLIAERTADLQHGRPFRRHPRTAVVLRRLAQRLDPQPDPAPGPHCAGTGPRQPRPWSAVRRPARPVRRG